jgi:RNA polymerase sigma-70 factor (ECF subfamily)
MSGGDNEYEIVYVGLDIPVASGFHETQSNEQRQSSQMTDVELRNVVNQVIAGDHQSFAIIVHHLSTQGWSLARRMMATRQDAEDALQDAFVKCFQSLPRFSGHAQLTTWFFRIVYTTCINHLRAQSRRAAVLEFHESIELADDENDETADETIDCISSELLLSALDSLPVRYRTVLTLFYVNSLSHAEIREITGMPIGTIKTNLHRGRQLLRNEVRQYALHIGTSTHTPESKQNNEDSRQSC